MFTIRDGREHFYTWDLDRQIIVDDPSIVEVHFCNRTDECSLVVEVRDEDGLRVANVPNIILQKSFDVRVFGYDGKATRYDKVFNVKARTRPADYVYVETEVLQWSTINTRMDELEAEIPDTVNQLAQQYVQEAITNNPEMLDTVTVDVSNAIVDSGVRVQNTDDLSRFIQSTIAGKDVLAFLKVARANESEVFLATVELLENSTQYIIFLSGTPYYTSGAAQDPEEQYQYIVQIVYNKATSNWSALVYKYNLMAFATEAYVDTAIATSKPVYLDFSALNADRRTATEEEAAVFERLYAGEQLSVNIRGSRPEYLPVGYTKQGTLLKFIYNRVSHTGSGVNTGDNKIAIDAAWYRAQRATDGTWTVWQSSGCTSVEVANKVDFDAAVTRLEDEIAAIEIGGGGGANVYTLDFSDVTETARDATSAESAVLDKILAQENLVLYITKNNISMPAEITYRTKDTLNLNYTRVRHRSGENISLTSIFYRAQYITGRGWALRINDYYEDLMVASQDWVRAQFDGIATAEGGAY